MKIITINVPEPYLDCIKALRELDLTPSRSEAMRECFILGFDIWIQRFNFMKKIIEIAKHNRESKDTVKVPLDRLYQQVKTYKIINRLDVNPNGKQ